MMRLQSIKPVNMNAANGPSHVFHLALQVLLPLGMFVLVRASFVEVALAIMLLSKWRMLVVRPRFWAANIRANAIDIIVGVSILVFMTSAESIGWQFLWAAAYAGWLIYIKPLTGMVGTSLQAAIGQLVGLSALFLYLAEGQLFLLVLISAFICYLAGRHYFDTFDEPYAKLYSYAWGYFGAGLVWVLGHWLLFYGLLAQPTLLLSVIGYGTATLYYLDHHDRLNKLYHRQFIAIMAVVVLVVLIFSKWSNSI